MPYASASPDDSYNCERVYNNGVRSLQIVNTKLQLGKTKNSLDALQSFSAVKRTVKLLR